MLQIQVELKLNNKEKTLLKRCAGYAKLVYNYGLWMLNQVKNNPLSVQKKLNLIRSVFTNYVKKQPENSWMNELPSRIYQHAFKNLQCAFDHYFSKKNNYPKYKNKTSIDSFTIDDSHGVRLVHGKKINIPALGGLRIKEELKAKYATQTFHFIRRGKKWFVSFAINVEKLPTNTQDILAVGVDLGLKTFATLSDGNIYKLPETLKRNRRLLDKFQHQGRNKQFGNKKLNICTSNNAKKHAARVSKKMQREVSLRHEFLHQTSTAIAKKYKIIRVENLNISGMVKLPNLTKSIFNQGWYFFKQQLINKQHYGCKVEQVDRYFPSSRKCRICNTVNTKLTLNDRIFVCEFCNHKEDRDLHAAKNLELCPNEFLVTK